MHCANRRSSNMQAWIAKAHSVYLDACVVGIALTEKAAAKQLQNNIFEYYKMHEIGTEENAEYLEWKDKMFRECIYEDEIVS
jgi:hypothetical protein